MVNEPVAILAFLDADDVMTHIPFRGTNMRTVQMNASFARIQNRLRKIDTYLQEKHTVCTMVTSERMRDKLKQLVKSEEPLFYDGHAYHEITILEIDFNDKLPWREPYPFSITYIFTDDDASEFDPDK